MTGRSHGVRIEIDAADKSGLGFLSRIDEPHFLVLTETMLGSIPSHAEAIAAIVEQFEVSLRAPERVGFVCR